MVNKILGTSRKTGRPGNGMVLILFILGAGILFFSNLGRTFASDDFEVINRVGPGRNFHTPGFFRPLSDLTLFVNYMAGGVHPVGYYLVNILIHAVNTFLVFIFCRRWSWTADNDRQRAYAWYAALFFLVYPFHSEGIDWVLGRGASLCTLFGLATLSTLVSELPENRKLIYSAIFYFLGMAAYEPVILLPLFCLIILYVRGAGRVQLIRWGSVLGVTLLLHMALRFIVSGNMAGDYGVDFLKRGGLFYAGNLFKVTARLFLPPSDRTMVTTVFFSMLAVVLAGVLLNFYRRTARTASQRTYLAALLLMLGISCALPVFAAVSTHTSETDRLLYLPSVFLCCALSLLLMVLAESKGKRIAVASGLVIYMVICLERVNRNWVKASDITRTILTVASQQAQDGKMFIINLPDEKDGAYIFRHGLFEALQMEGIMATNLVLVNHLMREDELRMQGDVKAEPHGSEIYIPPAVTIRKRGGDSVLLETRKVQPMGRAEEGRWPASRRDRIFYWNKTELVQVSLP